MITYDIDRFGNLTVMDLESGETFYSQLDWDRAPIAATFGWRPCDQCCFTDGTVACEHHTVSEMLASAWEYLHEHEGETAEDPGYFIGE